MLMKYFHFCCHHEDKILIHQYCVLIRWFVLAGGGENGRGTNSMAVVDLFTDKGSESSYGMSGLTKHVLAMYVMA